MTTVLTLVFTCALSAKGETTKISIGGADLSSPIVVNDRAIVRAFHVWSGAGTFQSFADHETEATVGFIVDGPSGVVDERPSGVPRYEVALYAEGAVPAYAVFYEFDATSNCGYVYLPGSTDAAYRLNVGSIFRDHGFEGHWLRASLAWQHTAKRILFKTE